MKEIIKIKGMHCRSCEVMIEDKIKDVKGINKVFANSKKGTATIYGGNYDRSALADAVKEAGYEIGSDNLPYIQSNRKYWLNFGIAIVIFTGLYIFGRFLGIEKILFPGASAASNLIVVFTIGLTAGISTCMAVVGGLVLGISSRFAEKHPDSTPIQKFRPHLFFNAGRIVSYFILGGVIGKLGSVFRLSGTVNGLVMILVGIVMIFLGVQILEIFPRFSTGFSLPKFIGRLFKIKERHKKEYSHANSIFLGALTFFLPCGFTQAMQVYAVTTGSFVSGALIMGVFAIGTTPGLLGIGGITALIKRGNFSQLLFKIVGFVVIALAIFNLNTGYNLTGIKLNLYNNQNIKSNDDEWRITPGQLNGSGNSPSSDIQVLKATYDQTSIIQPKQFEVKVGKPVRFEIIAKEDGAGCMGSVMIPGLVPEPQFFQEGQTVIFNFTPKKPGKYKITCAMGLQAGIINVIN